MSVAERGSAMLIAFARANMARARGADQLCTCSVLTFVVILAGIANRTVHRSALCQTAAPHANRLRSDFAKHYSIGPVSSECSLESS